MVADPRDELVGRKLGEFVVRARLGEGGFGAVYRAQQPLLGREAVIKVLHTRLRRNETAVQRFLREARLASRLDHPYAAHIYAFGVEQDGLLWIAMELVDGVPLDRWLRERGRLPLDQAVQLVERLCEVIDTAHRRDIIHRDIKPSNVMVLERAGRLLPKLLDLGIAKAAGPERAPAATDDTMLDRPAPIGEAAAAPTDATAQLAAAPVFAEGATAQLADGQPGPSAGLVLTQDGTALGSPPYMAPELWASSSDADARTDVYALGVLAFEVLANRRPFDGRTIGDLFTAHTQQPVPSLGEGFPAGLDGVLAKALAKRPDDRYSSTLELGAALRKAAELTPDAEPIPRLDPGVRDAWLAGAPQPIAEAIAAVEAARSVREARDAYRELVGAIVHYLGILTLASHWGAQRAATPELQPALQLIRDLRRRRFTEDDWRGLVRALAHDPGGPIPELARPDLAELGAQVIQPLAQARTDRQIREILDVAIAGLGEQLGRVAFLLSYPLGVVRDDRVDLWMGVRRLRRSSLPVGADAPPAGTPVLLDGAGRVALALAPLVEIAQPAPGSPEEVFLLDGRGSRGARLVALPIGFERDRDDVWDWFGARLLDTSSADTSEPSDEIAHEHPYPGLGSFTAADAGRFYGREKEVEAFLNRLRVHSLIAVVGASGSGKSSFVQAGVVPNLPAGWRAITIRPGPTPLASLEAALRKLEVHDPPTGAQLLADPAALGVALRGSVDRGTVAVVIDQFEELFTLCDSAAHQLAFAEALAQAARTADDPVRIVLTLRDDYLLAAEQLTPLRDRLTWGLQLLATPARADLVRILVAPARRAGFAFEDARLAEEMVDAVIDKPGALALIAFTAAELWSARDAKARLLTRASYEAMGGVGGALARHADGVVEGMVSAERRLVRETFRQVVTAEGTRAVINREDLRRVLADERTDAVLEKLIDARLLVTSEGPDSEDRIEIIHEALLDAWPRLRDWLREDAEGARLRDQLRNAARQWHERGRPAGLLWRGDPLAEYERWRARHGGVLGELDEEFAAASIADARRGRRIRNTLIAAGFAVLSIALAVFVYLRAEADRERVRAEGLTDEANVARGRAETLKREADDKVTEGLIEQGRQALLAGDVLAARAPLAEAYERGARGRALGVMLSRAVQPLAAQVRAFTVDAPVRSAELTPDGKRIVVARAAEPRLGVFDVATGVETQLDTGDPNAEGRLSPSGDRFAIGGALPRVWDLSARRSVALQMRGDRIDEVTWTADGTRVIGRATHRPDVLVWDAATGAIVRAIPVDSASSIAVRGNVLAMGTVAGPIQLSDLATGARLHTLAGHTAYTHELAFSADGEVLVSANEDGTVRKWNVRTGTELAVFRHKAPVRSVVVHRSGAILSASNDRTAKLWGTTAVPVQSFESHRSTLVRAVFDPTGTRIVTAGTDGRACIHDVVYGNLLDCLEGHGAPVTALQFDRDGGRILTASLDRTVRLWRADVRRYAASIQHRDVTGWHAFAPDGTALASVDSAGLIAVSSVARGTALWSNAAHEANPSVAFSPDGRQLLSSDLDAKLWNAATGELVVVLPIVKGKYFYDGKILRDHIVLATDAGTLEIRPRADLRSVNVVPAHDVTINMLAVSPDGARVATAGQDGRVRVFDVATGRRLLSLEGHTSQVIEVVFSPDGELIASASFDSTVRVWNRDGSPRTVLKARAATVWSPRFDTRGATLYTGHEDGAIRGWDVSTGAEVVVLKGHAGLVPTVAVDPRGTFLASGGWDGTVILWNIERAEPIARLEGHADRLMVVRFSPDGSHVASSSHDRTVKLWRVDDGGTSLEDEVALARGRTVQSQP